MKRQFISVLLVMLIIVICMDSASGATHYVDPGDFLSVIAGANDGDTVIFTDGLYHVNDPIYILDSLRLIAQHYGGAILKAESNVNSMVDVLVPGVTISGLVLDGNHNANDGIHGGFGGDNTQNGHFTSNIIRNCNNYGIFLNNSAYSVFSNNRVDEGRLGIAVLYSPLASLSGNRVTNVDCTGITVGESQLVTLTGNTVSSSGQDGILIRQSQYSRLEDNNALGNAWNGIALDRSSNGLIMDNRARNNGDCGVYLYSTDSTSVLLNDLLYNDNGVVISGGKDNNVLGNNINFNNIGVQMWTNNNVSYNNITNNTGTGIYIGSNQNSVDTYRIFNNTIIWNLNGILVVGSQNDINHDLLTDNGVFGNSYMLTVQGNGNLLNETLLYGNTNGLRVIGNDNVLTNITAVYNSLTGIIINGMGNTLDSSFILNNTNGISIIGNTNTINSILILNTTNGLALNGNENRINGTEIIKSTNGISITGNINTINSVLILNITNGLALNGNQNLINRTEILNGTNGIIIAGNQNNITNNNVYNNSNNGIYISGDNIVNGNYLTYNNGTGLVIRTDNNNVNLTNTAWNMILNNGGGITLIGDGNDIDNVLMLFNILLNNDYALTIAGNNNGLNNTIFTLNRNGLHVNGDNNSFTNITARNNNENGIIINGNNNSLNSSLIENNTNGLAVNGNQNTVNSTQIKNNTNGILINGSENTLNQTNIHNNSQTAVTLNGDNNTLIQNNITGSNEAISVENGTNNTINYNRIARNNHSLTNKGNGTVSASYNWWGQNNPTGITGNNIDISNHVVANLNIQNVNNGIIAPGTIYNVTLTLKSADDQELTLEIPSFLVQFFFSGYIYPEETTIVNNTVETQLQVFNPGTYTLKVIVDQQTLIKGLSTPVDSHPVNPVKIPRKPSETSPNNNICGAVVLANLLAGLGISTDAGNIASLAGITDQGISFNGLVQAAKYFGIYLTGLKLDSSELKAGDIVLLNMNGFNHYNIILSKSADYVILQDPFMGTIVLSLDEFNKFYTSYALTLNPNGRGTPLTDDEMKNLIGGDGLETLYAEWLTSMGVSVEVPGFGWLAAALLAVFGAVFFGGNYLLDKYAPNLIPHKGTGWKGLGIDLFNTLSPVVKLNPNETLTLDQNLLNIANWMVNNFPNKDTYKEARKEVDLADPNATEGKALGEGWMRCDGFSFPYNYLCKTGIISAAPVIILVSWGLKEIGLTTDKIIDSIFNIPNQINNFWKWFANPNDNIKIPGDYTINDSMNISDHFKLNNAPKISSSNSSLMMINIPGAINWAMNASNFIDNFKIATKNAYDNAVKPVLDRFNKEKQEFQQKELKEYAKSKVQQAKTYVNEKVKRVKSFYDKNLKPISKNYIAPVAHKYLDPIVKSKTYQTIRNLPVIKQAVDMISWAAKGLGLW